MTELKFWNTLTRAKEEFQPIDARMSACMSAGRRSTTMPISAMRGRRSCSTCCSGCCAMSMARDHVTYVRNITDVDDKINARALRDYPDLPLNEAIAMVTEKTADQFHKDAAALGCLEPSVEPRATEHIDGMVKMIQHADRQGQRLCRLGPRGQRGAVRRYGLDAGLWQAVEAQARRAAGRRPHRGRGSQEEPGRLRPVEGIRRRRARLGRQFHRGRRDRDHPRPSRLAHRVLGDERASPGQESSTSTAAGWT
jgi:hypothetical protein